MEDSARQRSTVFSPLRSVSTARIRAWSSARPSAQNSTPGLPTRSSPTLKGVGESCPDGLYPPLPGLGWTIVVKDAIMSSMSLGHIPPNKLRSPGLPIPQSEGGGLNVLDTVLEPIPLGEGVRPIGFIPQTSDTRPLLEVRGDSGMG